MPVSIGLIVDTETTGLGNRDEIVEIALILFEFDTNSGKIFEIIEEYTGLREPSVLCDLSALQVHGISAGMTRGKWLNKEKVIDLFTRTDIVFAHNDAFHRDFIQRLYPELPPRTWACTMRHILWNWEGYFGISLGDIATHYKIYRSITHRAYDDAMAVMAILRTNNCNGVPHIKQLYDRIHRDSIKVRFKSQSTGRFRKIHVSEQNDELLARCPTHIPIKLWTKPDYDCINGYIRGSIGGSDRVFQFKKATNKYLLSLLDDNKIVELHCLDKSDSSIEFCIVANKDGGHSTKK